MSEVTKLTDKELQSLKDFRQKNDEITLSLGQIEVQKSMFDFQRNEMLKKLSEMQEEQNTLAKELQDTYGIGNINIETGEFTTTE